MTSSSPESYGPTDTITDIIAPIDDAPSNIKTIKKDKKIRIIDTVTAITEYKSDKSNILNLNLGDTISVITKTESGWWDGVIFGEDSTARGWFPNTYTKSISLTAPYTDSTNAHSQSNKFLNLSALLRHNLNDDPRSRKNSTVSFASSEHSIHSEFTGKSHSFAEPTTKPVSSKDIYIVSPQEAESIFSSTGSSNIPIWTPVATTENTIVYYNAELNIYCKQLPYISNPEVELNSKIMVPTLSDDVTPLTTVNSNDLKKHSITPNYRTFRTRPSTGTSYDSRKDSTKSRASIHSTPIAVQPWATSLCCEPDLFYYDPTDITTWTGLRDAFNYFLTLTLDSLTKQAAPLFHTYFNIASRLGTLIHLSARLAQNNLQDSSHRERVQKRLRKIASSIAQLGINGNLYLTEAVKRRKSTRDTIKAEDLSPQTSRSGVVNSKVETKIQDEELNFQSYSEFLNQVQTEVENLKKSASICIKIFIQISNNLETQKHLPQLYPRFLTGFFSGGNWKNPFVPNPKDPFPGKEYSKQRKIPRYILKKEVVSELETKRIQLKDDLTEVLEILKNQPNDQTRNVDILSRINKSLSLSSSYMDILEGLDFQVFLNNNSTDFDPSKLIYSILTEFFESKQHLRDITVSIIMEAQNLTLVDPTAFTSIKEDRLDSNNRFADVEPEKSARFLEMELVKFDVENDDGISIDVDKHLINSILQSFDLFEISQTLVSQLVTEREALLNYATRVMDDFQYEFYTDEREDSAYAQEEYALPASTTKDQEADDNLPWYLDSEEFNLIFTNNDAIKGGTKEALIQRLTHHILLDASFNYIFLTSFRSMMKPTQLIDLLIKRFNIEPPENLSYEEYTDWVERKSNTVKLRVVNIMKSLLQKYWISSYNDAKLIAIWQPFIEMLVKEEFAGSDQLLKDFKKKVLYPDPPKHLQSESSISYPSRIQKTKILSIDPNEFADQLTLRDSGLYSKITQFECLDKSWNNKYGSLGGFQNLQKFISNSNDLTNLISTQIVCQTDIKKRVNIIKYFVDVADKCRKLNNLSSMTAIISSLYSSPVHRLKKTWNLVPQSTLEDLTKMNDLITSTRNFAEYREILRNINDEPCVPFLGVFLSDLTFTTNGNPDHLHGDPKLINFSKRARTVDILREMSRYQNVKYNLKRYSDLQDIIAFKLTTSVCIEDQYSISVRIEPKITAAKQVQAQKNSSISSVSTITKNIPVPKTGKYFTPLPPLG